MSHDKAGRTLWALVGASLPKKEALQNATDVSRGSSVTLLTRERERTTKRGRGADVHLPVSLPLVTKKIQATGNKFVRDLARLRRNQKRAVTRSGASPLGRRRLLVQPRVFHRDAGIHLQEKPTPACLAVPVFSNLGEIQDSPRSGRIDKTKSLGGGSIGADGRGGRSPRA